jgi:PAS domain S-box-containing protein
MLPMDALTQGALWWVAESLRGSVMIIDRNERIVYANRGAYDVCKLDPEERSLVGLPLEEAFSYTGFRRDISPVLRCLKTGEASSNNAVSTNIGEYVVDAAPIFSAGELVGGVALTYNVTDHSRLNQELLEAASRLIISEREREQSRSALDWVIESSPMSIVIVDREYRVTAANHVFLRIAGGVKASDVIGQTYDKALRMLHVTGESSVVRNALNGVPQQERHLVGDRVYDVSAFSITNPATGEIVGAIAMGNDITEKARMDAELMKLDRLNLVGELAATIAHEIRNPMTTVRGFLQLLQQKLELEPYESYTRLMIEELDRANAIITNYLSLSHAVSEQIPCNLSGLIREFSPVLEAEAVMQHKSITYTLLAEKEIKANEAELKQLITNLVKNALESMEPGGAVQIRTEVQEDAVILTVRDSGSGIPRDLMLKLGTPFVTTKEHGTGLGLAVCHRIVERHKAKIGVESSTQGSTFSVRFPVLTRK